MPPRTETLPARRKELKPTTEETKNPQKIDTKVKLDFENPLTAIIKKQVDESANRLLPWSQFMETSLSHPKYGYYTRNASIGLEKEKIDFTTSPECLPKFGNYIGEIAIKIWRATGSPSKFTIIEMGPGNGSLTFSLLDWAKKDKPEFYSAIEYIMIDQSPKLIQKQKEKLSNFDQDKLEWIQGSAIDLPKLGIQNIEGVFFSNEVPDTFAVERVRKRNGRYEQLHITTEKDSSGNETWFETWGDTSTQVNDYLSKHHYKLAEEGEIAINLLSVTWYQNIAKALKKGAILTIDYGFPGLAQRENAVRVYKSGLSESDRKNRFNPYKYLGNIDLTSDVNFYVLEEADPSLVTTLNETQDKFLSRYDIADELKALETRYGSKSIEYTYALHFANTKNITVLMSTKGIIEPIINPDARQASRAQAIEKTFNTISEEFKSDSPNEEKVAGSLSRLLNKLISENLDQKEINQIMKINLFNIFREQNTTPRKIDLIMKIVPENFLTTTSH